MPVLYDFALQGYRFVLRLASIRNTKAHALLQGQKAVVHSFSTLKKSRFWFHCASVGEFEQAMPLIQLLQKSYPDDSILLSVYSPSGFRYITQKHPALGVVYLPFDTKKNATRFIDAVQPELVFFIKYEFWFHFLTGLRQRNIPVFLVSGIFRASQPFFTWWGNLHRQMLACFSMCFVQNEESRRLLQSIGYRQAIVCGDTRFDRVMDLSLQVFSDERINGFCGSSPVFVAGSIWNSDNPTLKKMLTQIPHTMKIILVPHEPEHYDISWLNEPYSVYSQFNTTDHRVLLIDRMGLLSRLYRTAEFAYVGGGFGKGIHNILEAVVYAIPVCFGPVHQKFQEARDLLAEGIAFDCSDDRFPEQVNQFLNNKAVYDKISEKARRFMKQRTNVSQRIMVLLKENNFLPE